MACHCRTPPQGDLGDGEVPDGRAHPGQDRGGRLGWDGGVGRLGVEAGGRAVCLLVFRYTPLCVPVFPRRCSAPTTSPSCRSSSRPSTSWHATAAPPACPFRAWADGRVGGRMRLRCHYHGFPATFATSLLLPMSCMCPRPPTCMPCRLVSTCRAEPGPWKDVAVLRQLEARRLERLKASGREAAAAGNMTYLPIPQQAAEAAGRGEDAPEPDAAASS